MEYFSFLLMMIAILSPKISFQLCCNLVFTHFGKLQLIMRIFHRFTSIKLLYFVITQRNDMFNVILTKVKGHGSTMTSAPLWDGVYQLLQVICLWTCCCLCRD